MVCSSQNSFPHFRQLTLPFVPPSLLPHMGSEQALFGACRCQCSLVTSSSGFCGVLGDSCLRGSGVVYPLTGAETGRCSSFGSNTSSPLSFWLMTTNGWNFFALTICDLNHVLTSSCSTTSKCLCASSRCLASVSGGGREMVNSAHLLSWRRVTWCMLVKPSSALGKATYH